MNVIGATKASGNRDVCRNYGQVGEEQRNIQHEAGVQDEGSQSCETTAPARVNTSVRLVWQSFSSSPQQDDANMGVVAVWTSGTW